MLCVCSGASQPPADLDAAEHERRRFAPRPEPEKTRETFAKQSASATLCCRALVRGAPFHGECQQWPSFRWPCCRRALRERKRLFDDTSPAGSRSAPTRSALFRLADKQLTIRALFHFRSREPPFLVFWTCVGLVHSSQVSNPSTAKVPHWIWHALR